MKKVSTVLFVIGIFMIGISVLFYRNHMNNILNEKEKIIQEEKLKNETLKAEMENISGKKSEREENIKENSQTKDNIEVKPKTVKIDSASDKNEKEGISKEKSEESSGENNKKESATNENNDNNKEENSKNQDEYKPVFEATSEKITFTIKRGLNSEQIAEFLSKEGVVDKEEFLEEVQKRKVSNKLIYGTYEVEKGTSAKDIVNMLTWSKPN